MVGGGSAMEAGISRVPRLSEYKLYQTPSVHSLQAYHSELVQPGSPLRHFITDNVTKLYNYTTEKIQNKEIEYSKEVKS